MRRPFAFVIVALVAALSAPAQTTKPVKAADMDSTIIEVNTVKCQKCADAITTALRRVDGVQFAHVDLDTKVVKVVYYPKVVPVRLLERAIAYAGYDANKTRRIATAYEKLPACCK